MIVFEILKSTAFATYKEWFAYKSRLVVSIFINPVFFLAQFFIWQAVFSTNVSVTGFTLAQILTYYGICSVIGVLTMDSADLDLQMQITSGNLLTFLLRPISHCYYAFCQKIGHRTLSFWMEFTPIFLIYLLVFDIKLLPIYPLWALISIMLSFILVFLLNYCIGTLSFWFVKTHGLRRGLLILKDLCSGFLIPLTMFPESLQKILFFLPFQFITYVPAMVFIGSYNLAGFTFSIPQIVCIQLAIVIVIYFIYRILWFYGIKKFTGMGT